jgi:hypothetical protein
VAKQKWVAEKRAYDERRGVVAPTKPAGRRPVAATVEEPVHPGTAAPPVSTFLVGRTKGAKRILGRQISAKTSGVK